jgi:hypothetical protein
LRRSPARRAWRRRAPRPLSDLLSDPGGHHARLYGRAVQLQGLCRLPAAMRQRRRRGLRHLDLPTTAANHRERRVLE